MSEASSLPSRFPHNIIQVQERVKNKKNSQKIGIVKSPLIFFFACTKLAFIHPILSSDASTQDWNWRKCHFKCVRLLQRFEKLLEKKDENGSVRCKRFKKLLGKSRKWPGDQRREGGVHKNGHCNGICQSAIAVLCKRKYFDRHLSAFLSIELQTCQLVWDRWKLYPSSKVKQSQNKI